MMSSPMDSMGRGGGATGTWWVETWKSYIAAGLGVVIGLCGVVTAISVFPSCIIGGILRIIAALIVLAIEAPTFVAFLSFAQPIGRLLEDKPNWMKSVFYIVLAVIPSITGCYGLFHIFGFILALCIAAVYGLLVLGRKASRDEMRFQAAGSPTTQNYSPTSP